jgi:hypothetical protein
MIDNLQKKGTSMPGVMLSLPGFFKTGLSKYGC